jgi:hypothetical protein
MDNHQNVTSSSPQSSKRTPIERADDLDILSAIWILSCNDENPILTYRGIAERLGLSEGFDVKALVLSRSELFRPGAVNSRLSEWKKTLKSGKNRPAWIAQIRNKTDQEAAIDAITRDDVFRNQFRVETNAPKCEIQVIDWGLNHIDRLRKSTAEDKESRSRRWSTVVIPLVSLLVAGISVLSGLYAQWMSQNAQKQIKFYEVGFKPKYDAYSTFMGAIVNMSASAVAHDEHAVLSENAKLEAAFYSLEPFLDPHLRALLFQKMKAFVKLCSEHRGAVSPGVAASANVDAAFDLQLNDFKDFFQNELYRSLFA